MKPALYSYFRSSCSWRVRIVLALKNIAYEYKGVNLVKDGGHQHSTDYRNMNPCQIVPSLQIDGHILTESLSIIEYLEETHPEPALLPKDPADKAKVRALALHIDCQIQPLQNLKVLQYLGDDRKASWAKHFITEGFKALEEILSKTSGKYSFGDHVTFADCFLVPQVYNAVRFSVDMAQFPIIKRINDALMELDAFRTSAPNCQPDTPEDMK